jgi:transposase InsO family protein
MIAFEDKLNSVALIQKAVSSGARLRMACETVGISTRAYQRWYRSCYRDSRKGAPKRVPRKLSEEERQAVADTSCLREYRDLTPYEIVAIMAEKGEYIASERTFYRVLKDYGLLHHRGNGKAPVRVPELEELVATGPDQIWSWDITWMMSDVRGKFFFAYVVMDIWTEEIVGWEIHDREDDECAAALFLRLQKTYGMRGLFLRSDNGGPMKGATMRATLTGLGVAPTYGRPRVSNDNPFIESLFKTLKYTAGYPGHFKSLEHARQWMADFVNWYNMEHRHSSIGYVTPHQRRSGEYEEIFEKRNETFALAREKHPERWVNKQKYWQCKEAVYLNPGKAAKDALLRKSA